MPTVPDRLATPGPHFSVEFMPPRSDAAEDILWRSVRRLEPLRPAFVSVTYGAGGSRRSRTIRVTQRLPKEPPLLPVGDPPGDPNGEWVPHPQGLQYTGQLVALARSLGTFCVGVAAYPDKHPRSVDLDSDTSFLVDKIRAGAAYAITQMLFSVDDYLRLRERMCRAGVDVPVLPGLMPIISHARLMRIHELSGQRIPTELADELYRVRADPDAGRAIGMDHAVRMSERLLAEGAPCLHFYTFNRSKATVDVLAALGMAPALRR